MKRVGIYLRVSTDSQTTENQRRELEAVAGRSGWDVVALYEDAGISGAKVRPGPGTIVCLRRHQPEGELGRRLSVDRLGRSLQDLIGFLTACGTGS
jgi:DNA invertase Pin-like site-specific DNA recombinase